MTQVTKALTASRCPVNCTFPCLSISLCLCLSPVYACVSVFSVWSFFYERVYTTHPVHVIIAEVVESIFARTISTHIFKWRPSPDTSHREGVRSTDAASKYGSPFALVCLCT